jgi:SAM-dependent methyltransferase
MAIDKHESDPARVSSVVLSPNGDVAEEVRSELEPTTRLPFDVYQRYRLVADLVEHLAEGKALSVLDVGGATGVLRRFLPDHSVTLVDVQDSEEPGFVYGDGSQLPFKENSFDLVVTCDTLEHLPPATREAFLDECARTARRGVVIAGPYRHDRVDEAEETLQAFLHEKLQTRHRYLEEHRANGLPVRAEVEALFERKGLVVTSIGHGNLERWLALLCLSMYMDHDPSLRRIARDVYAFYNEALYASDLLEPVYRHAVVAVQPGVHLPTANELFRQDAIPRQGGAPEGSIEPFVHLAAELFAFDRESDVYQAERERLTAVVDGLVADLDGHKARGLTLEEDLAGHRGALSTLEGDLAGTRALAERLEQESTERLEALTATELDLEGHRRTVEALRLELAEHERHGAELQQELSDVREEATRVRADATRVSEEAESARERAAAEHAEQRAVIADRETLLAEHRELVETLREDVDARREYAESLERELRDVNALASRLNEEVAAEKEQNRAIERELASRWRNLKRVLRKRAG